MRAEHAAIAVDLVDHDIAQAFEKLRPLGVMRQQALVQHVRIADHDVAMQANGLTRIARRVDMRWELDGPNLAVMPDTPYLHTYKVDYVNMSRDTSGTVTITTQVASTGAGAGGTSAATGGGGNNSQTKIENKVQHHFW